MYDIYEKRINSVFAGGGAECLIVKDNIIIAHCRTWDNPQVVDHWDSLRQDLVGCEMTRHIWNAGNWRKLRGLELEDTQGWASDVVEG